MKAIEFRDGLPYFRNVKLTYCSVALVRHVAMSRDAKFSE